MNVKTKIMGIVNCTPDSFFELSRTQNHADSIQKGKRFFEEGADIIDVGGESTRPGALAVDEDEEMARVIPVIEALSCLPVTLSIDTLKGSVAKAAVKAGATLINDVSGFRNEEMVSAAVESNVDICVMHMKGNPQTMQINPYYEEGILDHLLHWFDERIHFLTKQGIETKKIILDPGIGFGKTVADNLKIIHNLPRLKGLGFPVLLGISRKSFLTKLLQKPPGELLPSTLAINTVAILSGIDIIRVHDVKEHKDVLTVLSSLQGEN